MPTFLKGRKRVMSYYGPGDGALHFCWRDDKDQGSGPKITRSMALRFLRTNKNAAHLRAEGWKVWMEYRRPVLVAPIERLDDRTLMVKGSKMTYTINDPDGIRARNPNDSMVLYHMLDLRTMIDLGDSSVVEIEVKNWGTRHSVCYFLAHEEAMKANPPTA